MANSIKERREALDGIFFARSGRSARNCEFYSCEGGGYEAAAQQSNAEDFILGIGTKGKVFLGNAFSLQMMAPNAIVCVEECSSEDIPEEVTSIIGHTDTASVVSDILGRPVECNRTSVHLNDGDVLYVAQLTGGRLPEGATKLPEGFSLTFRRVTVRC